MYVCICNALKCSQFKDAARSGANDVPSAFKTCGARPRCGQCFAEAAKQMSMAAAEPVNGVDPLAVAAE